MKNKETAKRLKEALNDNNMKPQDLATASNVSKASISQYVNGSHSPSNISAGKMAAVLGVNPLWLMGFDVEKRTALLPGVNIVSDEEFKMVLKFRAAEQYVQMAVKKLLGV